MVSVLNQLRLPTLDRVNEAWRMLYAPTDEALMYGDVLSGTSTPPAALITLTTEADIHMVANAALEELSRISAV